jgi:apolipoprotein N-acyltransferase
VRGVEAGLSVARAAGRGRLTATDAAGRVRTDRAAGPAAVTVQLPMGAGPTVFARIGNVFAWLCLAFGVFAAIGAARRQRVDRRG